MNIDDVKIYYPIRHKPRQIQIDALEFTKKQIRTGKKFIMLNMPTGSGKSLFNIMFINWYLNYINKDAKFDILTNTKILQRQYVDEFPFIANLKGKNSYRCNDYPDSSCKEGSEMNKALKRKCTNCPYDKDFNQWKANTVALTNFHYFSAISLFQQQIMMDKHSNVLLIDEAHDMESVICDFITNKISKHSLKMLGFTESTIIRIATDMKNIKTVDEFVDYIQHTFMNKLDQVKETLESNISNSSLPLQEKVKCGKYISNVKSAITNYVSFLNDYKINPNNWVIDIEYNNDDKVFGKNYVVQPVWSSKYLKELIWDKYDHVIMLSGTLLDKEIFSTINGINVKESAYIEFDSPFPIENRPIYFAKGIGKNTYTEKKTTFENQKKYVDKIINKYKDKKGIIHSGNYEISLWLEEYYKGNERFIFHTSENREEAIRMHIESNKPTILVSPSIITGLDFKYDLSRWMIIMKIPYPNLGSKKIKKRLEEYKDWYMFKTVADLTQGLGRSVRSETDTCDSYILDDCFSDILKYGYKFIPHYLSNAIKLLK